MSVRTKLFLSSTAAACLLAAASATSAATYVDPWTTSATGGISVVFGDNGLETPGAEIIPGETTTTHSYDADTGAFTDTFSFELPDGVVGFTLSSIGFATNSSLAVNTFTFNGVSIAFTNTSDGSGGNVVMGGGGPRLPVLKGGPQVLVVSGVGGPDSVFSGTATFEAGVVPEPASWALMILGFGGTGALLRRRRETLAAA